MVIRNIWNRRNILFHSDFTAHDTVDSVLTWRGKHDEIHPQFVEF